MSNEDYDFQTEMEKAEETNPREIDIDRCEKCNKYLSPGELRYSMNSYLKRPLCVKCQKIVKLSLAKSEGERFLINKL